MYIYVAGVIPLKKTAEVFKNSGMLIPLDYGAF